MPSLIRVSPVEPFWHYNIQPPYGLTADTGRLAIEDVYNFFYRINSLLVEQEGPDVFLLYGRASVKQRQISQ
jgi:hypothetical protein